LAALGANTLGLGFAQDLPLRDKWLTTLNSLWPTQALLIFDDVTDEKTAEGFLPPAGLPCRVLFTTLLDSWRTGDIANRCCHSRKRSTLELVEAIAGKEVREARGEEIAERSGGLPIEICPLAIQLESDFRHGLMEPHH